MKAKKGKTRKSIFDTVKFETKKSPLGRVLTSKLSSNALKHVQYQFNTMPDPDPIRKLVETRYRTPGGMPPEKLLSNDEREENN